MKKLLGIVILASLTVGGLCSQTVTVTKPAGGDAWIKGTPQTITWTKSGSMPNTVRISLRNSATSAEVLLIQDNVSNSGSYLWQIPASIADGPYKVRVKVKDAEIMDESDAFNIAASSPQAASINVTKPAAGDKWNRSKPYTITWTKNGSMPNEARIRLMDKNAATVVREIVSQTANSGSYSWTIPSDIPFGEYKIRVKIEDVSISDDSDTFEIAMAKFHVTPRRKEEPLTPVTPAIQAMWKEIEKPAVIKNWLNRIKNWGSIPPPSWAFVGRPTGYPAGADFNEYVQVGYDYFYCKEGDIDWWLTSCDRSQISFQIGEFQGQQGKLISAKMHVKQVSVLKNNDTSASCAVGLFYLLAPWTDWHNPQMSAQGIGAPLFNSTDYTIDITPTVKKWLDGSLANNGLLMVSREVDWGKQARICYSTFAVSLTLRFQK